MDQRSDTLKELLGLGIIYCHSCLLERCSWTTTHLIHRECQLFRIARQFLEMGQTFRVRRRQDHAIALIE